MRNIIVSVDDETHRQVRIRAAELDMSVSALLCSYLQSLASGPELAITVRETEPTVELRRRDLDEVLADFDARGVGLRSCDNLTRDQLYGEVTGSPDALR